MQIMISEVECNDTTDTPVAAVFSLGLCYALGMLRHNSVEQNELLRSDLCDRC